MHRSPIERTWLPRVNTGGRCRYGGFRYRVEWDAVDEIEVVDQSGDHFFSWILAGICSMKAEMEQHQLQRVRITVLEVFSHPLDSTEDWMQKQGIRGMEDLIEQMANSE